jgi:hypothetical protein
MTVGNHDKIRIKECITKYARKPWLIHCDWEYLVYEHGCFLLCRRCDADNKMVCERDLIKKVR